MTFARLRPGYIDDVETVGAATANGIDINQSRALDGTGGGSYIPTGLIDIGGSGLRLTATQGPAANVLLLARTATRAQSMFGFSNSGNWSLDLSLGWQNAPAAGGTFLLALDNLIHTNNVARVATFTVRWSGTVGHPEDPVNGGAMPIVMPFFRIIRVTQDGAPTILATATDTVVVRALYEAPHDIAVTITENFNLRDNRYVLEMTGETGGGFQPGAKFMSCRVAVSVDSYTEY